MKNKKLLFTLIAFVLCVCILIPLGVRLAWCKVTFVCKEGCEHVAWFRRGEAADATIVLNAHKDEHENQVLGTLHTDKEMLLSYLGEPMDSLSKSIYVNEWKNDRELIHITFYTPYGTILYYVNNSPRKIDESSFYAALEKMGGDSAAQYLFAWQDMRSTRVWEASSFSDMLKNMTSRSCVIPPDSVSHPNFYEGNPWREFIVIVTLAPNA